MHCLLQLYQEQSVSPVRQPTTEYWSDDDMHGYILRHRYLCSLHLTEIYEQVKRKAKIMHAEETKETKEIKEAKHEVKQTGETGNSIAEEEFEPLKVSRFIREKLEQPVEK